MKKQVFLLPIIILIFLFSSCAAGAGDIDNLNASLREVAQADYRANITAQFPEREVGFTLDYTYLRDGDDRAVILSPDEIADIAFTIRGDDITLIFDGANLEMGSLGDISPLTALSRLISVWTGGEVLDAQNTKIFDRDAILAFYKTHGETAELEVRTWFSKDNSLPLYAEIFSDGERIIQCEFEKVVTK